MYLALSYLFVSGLIAIPIVAAVLIAGGIVLYVFWGKKKRLENQILEAENELAKLKALPLKEKLTKLEIIGKNNVVFRSVYEEYLALYTESEAYYNDEILPEIDKARLELKNKRYENTITALRGVATKIDAYRLKLQNANGRLDEALKDDVQTREMEAQVRAKFQQYRDLYQSMEDDVKIYKKELEGRVSLISDKFNSYDDNLRRGNFQDAGDELRDIEKSIAEATDYLNKMRQPIVMATKELPNRLNETINLFNEMKDRYPLYHLSANTRVAEIKNEIHTLVESIRMFETDDIEESVGRIANDIADLRTKLENERESRVEYEQKHDDFYDKAAKIEESHFAYNREANQLATVYKIEPELKEKSNKVKAEVNKLSLIKRALEGLECSNQPYSARVVKIRELSAQIETVDQAVADYKNDVEEMKKDAEYAYKLVYDCSYELKNAELDLRNAKHEILIARYVESFNKAYELIEKLNETVSQTPIDTKEVKAISADLKMVADKILDDVKRDLAAKDYAERLIIFANAYRTSFSDVARGASKAEEFYYAGRFQNSIDILLKATSQLSLPAALRREETPISGGK